MLPASALDGPRLRPVGCPAGAWQGQCGPVSTLMIVRLPVPPSAAALGFLRAAHRVELEVVPHGLLLRLGESSPEAVLAECLALGLPVLASTVLPAR